MISLINFTIRAIIIIANFKLFLVFRVNLDFTNFMVILTKSFKKSLLIISRNLSSGLLSFFFLSQIIVQAQMAFFPSKLYKQ